MTLQNFVGGVSNPEAIAQVTRYLVVLMLAAGGIAAVIRSRPTGVAKGSQARLRELGWCAALLVISLSVLNSAYFLCGQSPLGIWTAVPVATTAILAIRPALAARVVPLALIALGLFGYVAARDYVFNGDLLTYGLTPVGNSGPEADMILPQAYAFLLAGGWLAVRSADPILVHARRWLGSTAGESLGDQLRRFALLPVVVALAGLFTPRLWLTSGAGLLWTAAILGSTLFVLRRWPYRAAQLATVGLLCLGIAGLVTAVRWNHGLNEVGLLPYAAVLVSTGHTAEVASVQGLGFLAIGAWLAPQTFPEVRRLLGLVPDAELTRRVQRLTETRAVAVDTASADLRRLERDLHDGAQARLVALGMSLRAAERLIPTSPEAAIALVAEARETSARALTELRELVRGVLPPVLADRGLADAVRALALDCPLTVETDIDLPGRLPAPVETACYFAVAEILTNAAKHSGARDARITLGHVAGILRIEVTDFGLGGADPSAGTGLGGVEKRLATFDGILAVSSPAGGPTIVVLEIPCTLSSLKTSSC
jgi:signal transduction histidine kinase